MAGPEVGLPASRPWVWPGRGPGPPQRSHRPNAIFRLWVDGKLDVERAGLDWVGTYRDYGINAVFLKNCWNGGPPGPVDRYSDRFVVGTKAIGC